MIFLQGGPKFEVTPLHRPINYNDVSTWLCNNFDSVTKTQRR